MKRRIKLIIVVLIVASVFLLSYDTNTTPETLNVYKPTNTHLFPSYLNVSIAGTEVSLEIGSPTSPLGVMFPSDVNSWWIGLPLEILILSETGHPKIFSIGVTFDSLNGYVENDSSHFKVPLYSDSVAENPSDFFIINNHKQLFVTWKTIFPSFPFTTHMSPIPGWWPLGNYTVVMNLTISLIPVLGPFHGLESNYVVTSEFPLTIYPSTE